MCCLLDVSAQRPNEGIWRKRHSLFKEFTFMDVFELLFDGNIRVHVSFHFQSKISGIIYSMSLIHKLYSLMGMSLGIWNKYSLFKYIFSVFQILPRLPAPIYGSVLVNVNEHIVCIHMIFHDERSISMREIDAFYVFSRVHVMVDDWHVTRC